MSGRGGEAHLAELLPVAVGDQRLERLEAGVDALHAPPLVAVGDLPADAAFLVPRRLRRQGNVGQAGDSISVTHTHADVHTHTHTHTLW